VCLVTEGTKSHPGDVFAPADPTTTPGLRNDGGIGSPPPLWGSMELTASAHEDFPMLYRSILMLLVELEGQAAHSEASRFRFEAARVYSRSWDSTGKRRLEQLEARLVRRITDGPTSSHHWWSRLS
jgi:hypothetical protein